MTAELKNKIAEAKNKIVVQLSKVMPPALHKDIEDFKALLNQAVTPQPNPNPDPTAVKLAEVDTKEGIKISHEGEKLDVGVKATPNGTYTLMDGSVVVIVDEIVTEMTYAAAPAPVDMTAVAAQFSAQLSKQKDEFEAKLKAETEKNAKLFLQFSELLEKLENTPIEFVKESNPTQNEDNLPTWKKDALEAERRKQLLA